VNTGRVGQFDRHAPSGYMCPFCLVVHGVEGEQVLSRQSDVILRTPQVTALICSHHFAHNPGHTLVIPNSHFEHIYELPAELGHAVFTTAQAIARVMKSTLRCDGVYLSQTNEPAGNQTVWHYHMHVIPRFTGDGFFKCLANLDQHYSIMPPERRAEHARQLRAGLAEQQG
jgi:histidine triad (HIT) family protein